MGLSIADRERLNKIIIKLKKKKHGKGKFNDLTSITITKNMQLFREKSQIERNGRKKRKRSRATDSKCRNWKPFWNKWKPKLIPHFHISSTCIFFFFFFASTSPWKRGLLIFILCFRNLPACLGSWKNLSNVRFPCVFSFFFAGCFRSHP